MREREGESLGEKPMESRRHTKYTCKEVGKEGREG